LFRASNTTQNGTAFRQSDKRATIGAAR